MNIFSMLLLDTSTDVPPNGTTDIIQKIIDKTNNELTIFFIIFALMLLIVGIPLFRMFLKKKKQDHDEEVADKKMLIDLIKSDNETTINTFKGTLDTHNQVIIDILKHIDNIKTEQREDDALQKETVEKMDYLIEEIDDIHDSFEKRTNDLKQLSEINHQNEEIALKIDALTQAHQQAIKSIADILENSNEIIELIALSKKEENTPKPRKRKTAKKKEEETIETE